MRIGLIGDVHAHLPRLQKALLFLEQHGAEQMICVGDVPDEQSPIDECLDLLISNQVDTVLGNHDEWLLEELDNPDLRDNTMSKYGLSDKHVDWLRSLPLTRRYETGGGVLLVCHGTNECNMSGVYDFMTSGSVFSYPHLASVYKDKDIHTMVCGHTHESLDLQLKHLRVLNPGWLGEDHLPGCAIFDSDSGELIRDRG